MIASTGSCLAAARFGLAPSVKKVAQPLKLTDREVTMTTGDPAGFTATDVLAMVSQAA
jgi:photosystem I reaction center PsaK